MYGDGTPVLHSMGGIFWLTDKVVDQRAKSLGQLPHRIIGIGKMRESLLHAASTQEEYINLKSHINCQLSARYHKEEQMFKSLSKRKTKKKRKGVPFSLNTLRIVYLII